MSITPSGPPRQWSGLVRIPQLIGIVAAVASIVILVAAIWAPEIFLGGGSQVPELDLAGLQLTAEATTEAALSDLAPTAEPERTTTPVDSGAAPASGAGEATATPVAPSRICPPDCVQIGAALEEFPIDFDAIVEFGELGERPLDLVMFFQSWGGNDREFKPWLDSLSIFDVAPVITWEPWNRSEFIHQSAYTQESILAGEHDAYIDLWALKAAEYGKPIYLRFAHEMNTPPGKTYWYPWQGDPEQYVAVWRYVHDRFEAAGAGNVEWVWSVAWMNDDARLYYPGDEYADWVSVTVLNFGEGKPEARWRSFLELYSIQQSRILSYNKPVMISELATAEQGGDKGQWIADIGDNLARYYPEIKAIVWLNYTKSREFDDINWRIDSSPAALEGWWDLMHHPALNPEVTSGSDD